MGCQSAAACLAPSTSEGRLPSKRRDDNYMFLTDSNANSNKDKNDNDNDNNSNNNNDNNNDYNNNNNYATEAPHMSF